MLLNKNKLFYFLLFLLSISLARRIYSYRERYLVQYDPVYWENRYLRSQWVVPASKEGIGDDGLYGYASWEYIHGRDPTTLNVEMPPVGKYLLGLTIVIFKNKNIFGLLASLAVLVNLYLLGLKVFANRTLSLGMVFLFFLEPLFKEQFRSSYLDSLYLSFLLAVFLFLLEKRLVLAGLLAGLFANTKSFLSSSFLIFLILITMILFNHESREKKVKESLKFLFSFTFITFFSYAVFFWRGHNLIDFLRVQKYIFNFYKIGAKGRFGDLFSMLILGKWHTWWDGVLKLKSFHLFWPITTILSFLSFLKIEAKKEIILLRVWLIVYTIFLLFIPVWPRYFLLLLPFSYILSIDFLRNLLVKNKDEK